MAEQDDSRDDEINALMKADGVDSAKIAEQIAKKSGKTVEPPAGEPPKTEPPKTEPPKAETPKPDVPNPEAIRAAMLNEMFGEQFKTVEDVKKANIPAALQELVTLRQKNQELDTLVKAKPKHHFANDDIAKMNEFVRETGIKDVNIFNRINEVADIANMPDMDALILQHIINNPRFASRKPQELRAYFETKYGVADLTVEEKRLADGDITQEEFDQIKRKSEFGKIELETDAEAVKAKLAELKGKIKMPEIPKEEMLSGSTKWTPEVETVKKAEWEQVNAAMGKEFSRIPIYMKGSKEPIINFDIPEENKSKILKNALDYVISNQLEATRENIESVAISMLREIKDIHSADIYQAIFERGRTIAEKEYLEKYHNPSSKNTDIPPGGGEELSDEAKLKRAYEGELTR